MQGRPFEVVWREEDTPEALKAAYQKERDSEVRTRLHGLWLLRCGWRLGVVAEAVGTHYRLLQRLKCGPKVPRLVHAKADLELQAAWKKRVSSRPWLERE
jgi:hypothetical protein